MDPRTPSPQASRLMAIYNPYKYWIEAILVLLSLGSYLLHSGGLLMLMLTTLSTFYFLSIYIPDEDRSLVSIISKKIIGIGSSVCCIGILFATLHLTGSKEMLMIGASSLAVISLVLVISWLKSNDNGIIFLVIRCTVLVALSTYLIMHAIPAS